LRTVVLTRKYGPARERVVSRCRVVRSPKQPAASHAVPCPAFVVVWLRHDFSPYKLLAQLSPRAPRGPSKGLAEASSPPRCSSRAPELPTDRFEGAGGSLRCDSRPETLVRRRPAKGDAFGKVEVLFTGSESEIAVKAHAPPAGLGPCSLSRRPFTCVICGHCSREQRLCFQLRGASP